MKYHKGIFKSAKEEQEWRHKTMLTVGKLIEWLQQFDPDTLVYRMESNTCDWQEIPDFWEGRKDNKKYAKDGNMFFCTLKKEKKSEKEHLNHWYSGDEEKVKAEFKRVFQYCEPNGIMVRM